MPMTSRLLTQLQKMQLLSHVNRLKINGIFREIFRNVTLTLDESISSSKELANNQVNFLIINADAAMVASLGGLKNSDSLDEEFYVRLGSSNSSRSPERSDITYFHTDETLCLSRALCA